MFLPWGWKNDNISGEAREAQLFFFFSFLGVMKMEVGRASQTE